MVVCLEPVSCWNVCTQMDIALHSGLSRLDPDFPLKREDYYRFLAKQKYAQERVERVRTKLVR